MVEVAASEPKPDAPDKPEDPKSDGGEA